MAPNPRVAKAFRAMKEIGILEEKTKPVLKNLLKVYEKNWELIEAENYRALADAIFDSEEAEASEKKKNDDNAEAEAAEQKKKLEEAERLKVIEEETQIPEEPERPLKRLRLRHQDGTALKKPKLEIDDLPYTIPRSQARAEAAKEKQPVLADDQPDVANESLSDSGLHLRHLRNKGKELISPQTDHRELRSSSHRPSHGVRFKEPKPKETALSLIKPKDEPVTDDTLPPLAPLSVVIPDSSINGVSSTENNLPTEANENSNNSVVPASSDERNGRELATIPDESIVNLDVASSSSGEIKISVTCIKNPNLSVTNVDTLLKKMEDKCLQSYKILDSNFSLKKLMNDICDSLLDTEPEPDYTPPTEPLENDAVDVSTNGSVDQQINQLTADIRSVHDINDIAKGQESVIISLVNEVNTKCPPAFHYIAGNAVFQNASVNFSLARIGDDNCCSACFGNCLTSASSCVCALQAGGEFAYTKEGLVKEELLDECVNMNRDPQKHCLFYCKECPLERSKTEGDCWDL